MNPTKKLNIEGLEITEDQNINSLLVYGIDSQKDEKRLLVHYTKQSGIEKFYDLNSILDNEQRIKIVDAIQEYDSGRFEL